MNMSAKVLNDGFTEYLKKLEVTQDIKDLLEEARLKVKDALKKGIVKETLKKGNAVSPRFMRQGSAGYRTQNMPLNPPKQQVDFDYGCYLPLSYHKDGAEPEDAADDFFDMVDSILTNIREFAICVPRMNLLRQVCLVMEPIMKSRMLRGMNCLRNRLCLHILMKVAITNGGRLIRES
jgi:hypothetical protein